MKKNTMLSASLLLVMGCCCTVYSQAQYSGYVKYVGSAAAGTVTVESTGFGKKRAESGADAAAEALYTLLFKGLPGSSDYQLPMVAHEEEKKHDPVIIALLNGGYGAYITADILKYEENKKKRVDGAKGKMTIHVITFNCDALRRHLEENSVIRKFGY